MRKVQEEELGEGGQMSERVGKSNYLQCYLMVVIVNKQKKKRKALWEKSEETGSQYGGIMLKGVDCGIIHW